MKTPTIKHILRDREKIANHYLKILLHTKQCGPFYDRNHKKIPPKIDLLLSSDNIGRLPVDDNRLLLHLKYLIYRSTQRGCVNWLVKNAIEASYNSFSSIYDYIDFKEFKEVRGKGLSQLCLDLLEYHYDYLKRDSEVAIVVFFKQVLDLLKRHAGGEHVNEIEWKDIEKTSFEPYIDVECSRLATRVRSIVYIVSNNLNWYDEDAVADLFCCEEDDEIKSGAVDVLARHLGVVEPKKSDYNDDEFEDSEDDEDLEYDEEFED